jgi:hypothetical protein
MEIQHYAQNILKAMGLNDTQVVPIQGLNEDFRVKKITGSCSVSALTVLVQITITQNSRTLSNQVVPFNDLVGTAQLPSFIENLIFPARTNVNITIVNNGAAQNVSITFIGEKLYK